MSEPEPFSEYPELVTAIRRQYLLRWEGTHGFPHWVRVRTIGRRLASIFSAWGRNPAPVACVPRQRGTGR
jgi:hypothetical protein